MLAMLKHLLSTAVALVLLAHPLAAQTWPSKPLKVIIPFGAGSAADVIPRLVFDQMSQQIGQPIIIENRPGAGSTTGNLQVAKADSDGHTFLATSSAYSIVPAFYDKLGYDPVVDLLPVGLMVNLPSVLIVPATLPVSTVQEFVALANSKPGTFNYASLGAGSGTHLAAERFRVSAGIDAAHVAFKSGSEALTEIIAGRIHFYMCPVGTAMPFIQDGKVKGLAVAPAQRVKALPNTPTTLEADFKDSDSAAWLGVFAPKGTSADVIARFHAEMAKAVANPDVTAKLAKNGVEPDPKSIADFAKQVAQEIQTNTVTVKKLGLKAN
jgi:tripartite-type tricarboxylate transporter receptor subunit TctC